MQEMTEYNCLFIVDCQAQTFMHTVSAYIRLWMDTSYYHWLVVQLRLTPAVCLMMQLAVMLSATESIQTHFRKEILKMCEEIAGHKLHVQKLQNEVEQRNAKIKKL